MTVEAKLYYGYYLGCPGVDGWRTEAALTGTESDLPWVGTIENGDYAAAMERALLESRNIRPGFPSARRDHVLQHWGVEVVQHGLPGALHYGLAVAGSAFACGTPVPRVVAPSVKGDPFDLERALEALGMRPLQRNPAWLLAAGEY